MAHLVTAGENAIMIYFGEHASAEISAQVQAACPALEAALGSALIDLVPSYASLLVLFDPLHSDHYSVRKHILSALAQLDSSHTQNGNVITLPVYYHVEVGEDLPTLAQRAGLSEQQVIDIHSSSHYRVYAIGFAPGFAYLGEVDERIAAPRLATPRQRVPRGAVAIADRQTAIYPAESPGGWNLIGRCPVRMFDPEAEPVMPVAVGDSVRFEAIDRQRYLDLGGEL